MHDACLRSGNARYEPGAVVCRVSPSFVRFGTFQLPALRGGAELPLVRTLADYVIRHLYPQLEGGSSPDVLLLASCKPCADDIKQKEAFCAGKFPAEDLRHIKVMHGIPGMQENQTIMWRCCERL
jgi:hypothetical protein